MNFTIFVRILGADREEKYYGMAQKIKMKEESSKDNQRNQVADF